MYQQPPPSINYPGYIMPNQPGQGIHNYPPTDMYFMPNMYNQYPGKDT